MYDPAFEKAEKPTMYFIGVTTGKSSIMKVFPAWANALGLRDSVIRGIDYTPHADPEAYRSAVRHIKYDELSLGALVTTHKIDLLRACRSLFDELDPYSGLLDEVSCISKRDGKLVGHAKDPIAFGLALQALLPANYWEETKAEALVLGAGGSSIASTSYLLKGEDADKPPSRIIVTDCCGSRLEGIRRIHDKLRVDAPVEYHHCPQLKDNDRLVSQLGPHSLVINATGLGKDAPGSPITDEARFPVNGIAWDFNYRGDLEFLDQARAQQGARSLRIEDGWVLFVHGWLRVIAEVFHVDIPTSGPRFEELSRIAAQARGSATDKAR